MHERNGSANTLHKSLGHICAMKSILVFCGARTGQNPAYQAAASEVGKQIAQLGIKLIFGGGRVGLMGAVADATLDSGGTATGIIPTFLVEREAHHSLSELIEVKTMHERKALMLQLADAVLILPGGHGTFDEMFEMLTWEQLGLHNKPIGLLNVEGYYDHLLKFLDTSMEEGFISAADRNLLLVDTEIEPLLSRLIHIHASSNGLSLDA
jgi:uncharacterized protein (TIGR00730 family)